jgi:two-component system chemotaxis response regulator CheB
LDIRAATRVLIVDDSATMRRLIRKGLESDPGLAVVAEAGTAREARDAVRSLSPDVMTLDIEMPGMDGLEFLRRLMNAHPMPVIMLSSLTAKGSEAAVRALSLGAVDCVEKPGFGQAGATFVDLAEKLHAARQARVLRRPATRRPARQPAKMRRWNGKWILIGASTGGVEALEAVLRGFPADCPPTLITQHMPAQFLESFAARLDAALAPKVRIAGDGDRPKQGEVLIAPGDRAHLRLAASGKALRLIDGPKRAGHRPSVDEMMLSAVPFGPRIVAAILTGMGRDGAEGMRALRRAGAVCFGQNEATCVVYGMPRVAMELGGIDREVPIGEMGDSLLAETSQ